LHLGEEAQFCIQRIVASMRSILSHCTSCSFYRANHYRQSLFG